MKQEFREKLKDNRKNLSTSNVLEKSNKIKKLLFEMKEFKEADTILFYISYDNEVFTHDMIKESILIGKEVVVPLVAKKNRRLILSIIDSWDVLELGAYNILEPKKEFVKEASVGSIDLIIVPGVGFDEQGRRIGHGMGYYDNLLKNSALALKIGLAFEFQIVEKIPVEKHDVPVDMIVTENRVINCSR